MKNSHTKNRHLQSGFTIIEALISATLLSIMVAVTFTGLMQSYTMNSEARYYENARAVLLSFADQFSKLDPYKVNPDKTSALRPLFSKQGQYANTGYGMVWPSAVESASRGSSDPDNTVCDKKELEIRLYSDDDVYGTAGTAGVDVQDSDADDFKTAFVSRTVELDPTTLNAAKGQLLIATFKIRFASGFTGILPDLNSPATRTLTVCRTIDL